MICVQNSQKNTCNDTTATDTTTTTDTTDIAVFVCRELTIVVAACVSQLANRAAMASRANAVLAAHRAGRTGYPLNAVAALAASQLQSRRAALANAVVQANLAQANLSISAAGGLTQGAALTATPGATAGIAALSHVPVVSAAPVVSSAGQTALTSNPLAASLAAVAAQAQQPQQQAAANAATLQGMSP